MAHLKVEDTAWEMDKAMANARARGHRFDEYSMSSAGALVAVCEECGRVVAVFIGERVAGDALEEDCHTS